MFFRKPTSEEFAAKKLQEAKIELQRWQMQKDYTDKMVEMYQQRIKRLSKNERT